MFLSQKANNNTNEQLNTISSVQKGQKNMVYTAHESYRWRAGQITFTNGIMWFSSFQAYYFTQYSKLLVDMIPEEHAHSTHFISHDSLASRINKYDLELTVTQNLLHTLGVAFFA